MKNVEGFIVKLSSFFILSPVTIVLFFSGLGLFVSLNFYSEWSFSHTLYTSGVATFCFFYVLSKLVFSLGNNAGILRISPLNFKGEGANRKLMLFYWMMAVVGAFLSVYQIVDQGSGSGNLFYNLRYAHTIENQTVPLLAHFSLFSFVLALYYIYKGYKKLAFIALSLSLLPAFATAAKAGFLFNIASVSYLYFIVYGLRAKYLLISSFLFFFLILIVTSSAGKLGGSGGQFFLFSYLGYGITAFDDLVFGKASVQCYSLVFGNIVGGLINILLDTSGSCSFVPKAEVGSFNVYTYMYAPYVVFGAKGVIFLMAFLGIFYAILDYLALAKGGPFLLISSTFIYPLMMIFFDWQFDLSTFVYVSILTFPLFFTLKPKRFLVAYD